jgi:hypothetical protein
MADRFSGQVGRILDLAPEEAERFGHRYVGPEHLVLALLRDGSNPAARMLQARGAELAAARAALGRLADRGVVPGPRPSDAELLGTLGIDLEAIRRDTEQSFGIQALQNATREATRARRGGVGRVPRTPLCGPALLTTQATWLASRRAEALGHGAVGRSCCCSACWRTSGRRGPGACPTRGCGSSRPPSACPRATGARPGHCWPHSGWSWTSCTMRYWPNFGRRCLSDTAAGVDRQGKTSQEGT